MSPYTKTNMPQQKQLSHREMPADKSNAWRFKFAISAILIAFFLGVTLRKLSDFGVSLEKENVENQIENFRLGLTEAWISRNIAHKNANISAFENGNPMLIIADVPKNYIGEYEKPPSGQKAVWYFDQNKKQLVYVLNSGELLRFEMVKNIQHQQKSTMPNGGLALIAVEN